MFDLLKVLVEYFGKTIDPREISKIKQQKELKKLGSELFLIYLAINETVVAGEQIISSLEYYVRTMDDVITHERENPYLGSWGRRVLARQIIIQSINIERLFGSLQRFRNSLGLINEDAYWKLNYLLDVKQTSLELLIRTLMRGKVPLSGTSEQEIKEHLEQLNSNELKNRDSDARFDYAQKTGLSYEKSAIPTDETWDQEVFFIIIKYLRERNPREQLKHIHKVAAKLRQTLEKHFSISDILLDIGEKRLLR